MILGEALREKRLLWPCFRENGMFSPFISWKTLFFYNDANVIHHYFTVISWLKDCTAFVGFVLWNPLLRKHDHFASLLFRNGSITHGDSPGPSLLHPSGSEVLACHLGHGWGAACSPAHVSLLTFDLNALSIFPILSFIPPKLYHS